MARDSSYDTAIQDNDTGARLTLTPRGLLPSFAYFDLGGNDVDETERVVVTAAIHDAKTEPRLAVAPCAIDLSRGSVPDFDFGELDDTDFLSLEEA